MIGGFGCCLESVEQVGIREQWLRMVFRIWVDELGFLEVFLWLGFEELAIEFSYMNGELVACSCVSGQNIWMRVNVVGCYVGCREVEG